VVGWDWDAGATVRIEAVGVPKRTLPLQLGFAVADSNGNFNALFDVRCTVSDTSDPDYGRPTIIWAHGDKRGVASGGTTYGFTCQPW
jgi:hypothetical protein